MRFADLYAVTLTPVGRRQSLCMVSLLNSTNGWEYDFSVRLWGVTPPAPPSVGVAFNVHIDEADYVIVTSV